jgi:pyruvate/2-oxoglutarate dehydrogenase complex dihydrolipoamide acyltransferase (E2) component
MSRARHAPRHSRAVLPGRPPRPRTHRLECIAALGVAVLAVGAVAAVHANRSPAASAAYSTASCVAPKLDSYTTTLRDTTTADSNPATPLGVNATSTSQLSSATQEFGHLPVIRVYYTGMPDPNAWTTGAPGINKSAVVLSFRVPPATILSGVDDAALAHFFDTAPVGHPIYYSYYHEPEPFISSSAFTLAQYQAAWAHIVAIADAANNPYLKSTLILMTWDLDPASGIDWKDFLPPGHVISTLGWDAYPSGTVHDTNPQPTSPADFMGAAVAASKSVGLPFGFAEFALGTATGRPAWLAEVASYLRTSGAEFGTLFNSTGFPWMELNDSPSTQAWRTAVADSQADAPGPTSPTPTPSAPAPTPSSATPTPSSPPPAPSSPAPTPTATTLAAPVISEPTVSPAAFAPNGGNHVRILFKLSQPASISICVETQQGAVLRELDSPDQPAGWPSSWYFGHDSAGNLLPPGSYPVVIQAANRAGVSTAQTELTITSP